MKLILILKQQTIKEKKLILEVSAQRSYNKLISRFKGVDIPGTGVSIGVDRLFAMIQLNEIKLDEQKPVIVCVMDEKYLKLL